MAYELTNKSGLKQISAAGKAAARRKINVRT